MKIAFFEITATFSYGGIQSHVWGMAKALAASGHTAHVYGGRGQVRGDTGGQVKVFIFPFIPRSRIPNLGSRFRKFVERASFSALSLRTLIRERYDVIYAQKPYDLPLLVPIARACGARLVFHSGGTEFFPLYRRLAARVDCLLACSEFNASQIEAYCGLRPRVFYYGIDTERFSPGPPDEALMKGLGVRQGQKVLVSACRLVGWKGLQYAIRAVAALSRRHDLRYIIIGEGEYRGELERLCAELGVGDRVVFAGVRPNKELPGYYSFADAALFPSVADETFGISIAEAMACGVPVVAGRVGGIPEVVPEGGGFLVEPRQEGPIADALERLFSEQGLGKRVGDRGRRFVVDSFGWKAAVARFERYMSEGCG